MRRSRRKYGDDPLVAFAPERLQAAVRYSDSSVAALAAVLHVPQPTLQYVVSGKNRRCRRSLLEKMAKRLCIERRWLEGDPDAGPFVDRQRELAKRQGTSFRPSELRPGLPPLAELRAGRLVDALLAAWKRDLKTGAAPAPAPKTVIGQVWRTMNEENRWTWIGAWLERLLLTPTAYREAAFVLPAKSAAGQADLIDWLHAPDEVISTSLVGVLEHLLGPWLEESRPLNYPAVYVFLQALADRTRGVSRIMETTILVEPARERHTRPNRRRIRS